MGLIQYLKTDEELKELRSRWKEMYSAPFPPYNWDEYDGIEDYKTQIRNKIERYHRSVGWWYFCTRFRERRFKVYEKKTFSTYDGVLLCCGSIWLFNGIYSESQSVKGRG